MARTRDARRSRRILAVDVGGSRVKVLATGSTDVRKASSKKGFTPPEMVDEVRKLAADWEYEAVSIGFPGPTGHHGPVSEPGNLGTGWVGFDFAAAFEKPVKIVNDAAMQALGSYEGGRMLFLGLGTGLGSALIAERAIIPLELSHLPWREHRVTLGDMLSRRGLKKLGRRRWRRVLTTAACSFMKAFLVDYVVIGGGNAKYVDERRRSARGGSSPFGMATAVARRRASVAPRANGAGALQSYFLHGSPTFGPSSTRL